MSARAEAERLAREVFGAVSPDLPLREWARGRYGAEAECAHIWSEALRRYRAAGGVGGWSAQTIRDLGTVGDAIAYIERLVVAASQPEAP
ncbi:MAG: hypothetical protein QW838_04200 [Candidatus Nitrosotenuis sp.]